MDYIKNSTVFLLERAMRLILKRTDATLERLIQCHRREVWVMLCAHDTKLSQKQIGELLGMHPNVLVKILDGMELRGLVQRVARPEDRREQIIEVTEEGKRRLDIYAAETPKSLLEIFAPLNREQIEMCKQMALLVLKSAPIEGIDDQDG